MTILESIRSGCHYTLGNDTFLTKIRKRGLNETSEATTEVLNSRAFELAEADVMIAQIPAIRFSEGSLTVDAPDAEALRALANSVYRKHGEPEVLKKNEVQPEIRYSDW